MINLKPVVSALIWLIVVIGVITVPRSSTDPFRGDAVTDLPFEPLTYGIQAFMWWGDWWATVHSQWVQTMAFTHIKQTFAWEDIEPVRGEYNFTPSDTLIALLESRNLRVVARLSDTPAWAYTPNLDPTGVTITDTPPDDIRDWGEFCGAVASRYRGRIAAYQIWNEPNLSREWGGREPIAAGYVGLLEACSSAIRAADPDAILISAGLAPTGTYDRTAHPDDLYLQALYELNFQRHIDVVGMHAPGFSAPDLSPAEAEQAGGQRFFTFRRVEDLRKIMVANGDAARQVAILEVGYTTDQRDPAYSWFAVDEAGQARYLSQAYAYAAEHWRPWVGLMSAIYIANPTWTEANEEYWWSITTPDGRTAQAYVALANMPKYCGDTVIPARDPGSPEALGLAPSLTCLNIRP